MVFGEIQTINVRCGAPRGYEAERCVRSSPRGGCFVWRTGGALGNFTVGILMKERAGR